MVGVGGGGRARGAKNHGQSAMTAIDTASFARGHITWTLTRRSAQPSQDEGT